MAISAGLMAPAHGVGYWAVALRWGSASAQSGSLHAVITLQDVRAAQEDPDQQLRRVPYACLLVVDEARDLQADACPDAQFEIAADLSSATATGSTEARLLRHSDGSPLGTTTIRYDVRWVQMSRPTPRVGAGAQACPSAPWAPEWLTWVGVAGTDVYSSGSATGTVSADAIGSVDFNDDTLTWWTALGESTGAAVFDGIQPPTPLALGSCQYAGV
jgi:hypothetical protein